MYHPEREVFLPWTTPEFNNNFIPSIIWREILSTRQLTGKKGDTMKDLYEATKENRALRNDSDYLYGFMGDHYPVLEIWKCDMATGQATLLATNPPPGDKGW